MNDEDKTHEVPEARGGRNRRDRGDEGPRRRRRPEPAAVGRPEPAPIPPQLQRSRPRRRRRRSRRLLQHRPDNHPDRVRRLDLLRRPRRPRLPGDRRVRARRRRRRCPDRFGRGRRALQVLVVLLVAVAAFAGFAVARRRRGVRHRPRLRAPRGRARRGHRHRARGDVVPRRSQVADRPGAGADDRASAWPPRPTSTSRAASADRDYRPECAAAIPATDTSWGSGGSRSTCAASTGRRTRSSTWT